MLVLGLVDIPWWVMLIVVIVAYLRYTTRNFDFFKKQGIPETTRPLPVFGTTYRFFTKGLFDLILENMEMPKEKGCIGAFTGSSPVIEVHDEKMLAEIMIKEFSAFTDRWSIKTGSLADCMLVNLYGSHWRYVRNEMSPTFTTGKLKKMNEEVNRCAQNLVESLTEAAKLGEMVEIKEYTGGYTMDVIASTAFGIRVDSQKDRNNTFVTHARKAFDTNLTSPLTLLRIVSPTLNTLLTKLGFPLDTIPKDSQEFFYDITRQAMEVRKEDHDQSRSDFLQLMLKAQKGETIRDHDDEEQDEKVSAAKNNTGLSTDDILANAMLFFVAGYDTTSTSLSFFLYNMAVNPECQAKLIEEIDSVIGNKDFVDYNILQEMSYLEQCINENLRIFPPLGMTNRTATRDITINGIFIRKGMVVNIPIFGIHRDPQKWPEPGKFDPERFSPENKKERNPYHFMPFGNGPRNCIGMRLALLEMKVAIVHIFRKIKFSTCERTLIPMQFSNTATLLKSKDGIWLKMELRNEK